MLAAQLTVWAVVVMVAGRIGPGGRIPQPRTPAAAVVAGIDARIDALVADPVGRARLAERMRADLLTTEEVGALLGVSPQRVHQLSASASHPDFPTPVRQGARWSRRLTLEFRERWQRDPGRRAGS